MICEAGRSLLAKGVIILAIISKAMITEVAAAIGGAVIGKVVDYGLQKRNEHTQKLDEWYEDAITQISRGHCVCTSARRRSNLNYGSISDEADKVSENLKDKVNPYPEGTDETTVVQIANLAEIFQKVSAVTEATEDQSTEESIKEIFDMGKREYSGNDKLDMSDAVKESTEYSPIMEQVFEELDVDPRLFGSQFGDRFGEADSIDELVEEMSPVITQKQNLIEKSLESQLSDDWDESLSLGVRVHLQIASNLCEESIYHISSMEDMNTAT